jgi:mevalonate kinase
MKVYAPGKLILSGEHAVVYGSPALAMAVNRYAVATVTRDLLPHISFDLSDLAHRSRLSIGSLQHIKDRIKRKYHRFIRGEYTIRQVLHKPFELAQFALGVFAESLNMTLPHGVNIHVKSDIPIGSGMGSSAAMIISVMHAVSTHLKINLSQEALFNLALETENMQHGHSSGLDLRVALQGGCLYMHGNDIQSRTLPEFPMYLVNTGTPVSSTGQCVEKAAAHFQTNHLADEFSAVTRAMDAALKQHSCQSIYDAIRHNHDLLVNIGVVPDSVQQFVSKVESMNGAAKICGAGAIEGDKAGAVLVLTEDEQALGELCTHFGYEVTPISGEARGVHAV